MTSALPTALAFLFVIVMALGAAAVFYVWRVRQTAGFRELALEVKELERVLDASVFRDGPDLVVSGNYGEYPTVVRFSKLETTPGLNVRMSVPATFDLTVAAKGSPAVEGRAVVPTGDMVFDARFASVSSTVTQARMFLAGRVVAEDLKKLLCSSNTFFGISRGSLELSELEIPEPYTAQHVMTHVRTMGKVAAALRMMPGADKVRIERLRKEGRRAFVLGGVAVVLVAVLGVMAARAIFTPTPEPARIPEGMSQEHALQIPGLENWRLADERDYSSAAVSWLRQNRGEPSGRIDADFSGTARLDQLPDVAYILIGPQGTRRVAILLAGQRVYDSTFPELALAARVPHRFLAAIQWLGDPPQQPAGDGLLLVRTGDQVNSGLILYLQGSSMAQAMPADYTQIPLR